MVPPHEFNLSWIFCTIISLWCLVILSTFLSREKEVSDLARMHFCVQSWIMKINLTTWNKIKENRLDRKKYANSSITMCIFSWTKSLCKKGIGGKPLLTLEYSWASNSRCHCYYQRIGKGCKHYNFRRLCSLISKFRSAKVMFKMFQWTGQEDRLWSHVGQSQEMVFLFRSR